jgi:hypothetical protein
MLTPKLKRIGKTWGEAKTMEKERDGKPLYCPMSPWDAVD